MNLNFASLEALYSVACIFIYRDQPGISNGTNFMAGLSLNSQLTEGTKAIPEPFIRRLRRMEGLSQMIECFKLRLNREQ